MKNYGILKAILLAMLFVLPGISFAQTYPDSTVNTTRTDSTAGVVKVPTDSSAVPISAKPTHSVRRATILSAVLPGAGQIYNKKYWKLPILYGAFAGLGYLIHFNNQEYHTYNDALVARQDNDPNTVDTEFTDKYSDENLRSLSDYYHRNRDLSILLTIVVYSLNIMDAHVDAHLYSFNVSEDLSLHVDPVLVPSTYYGINTYRPGLGISMKF